MELEKYRYLIQIYVEKIVNCHHFCVWKKSVNFVIKECVIPQMVRLCLFRLVWPQVWHWGKKRAFTASVEILTIGKDLFFHLQLLITLLINFVKMLRGPGKR